MPAAVHDGAQVAPAEVQPRVERLGVEGARLPRIVAEQRAGSGRRRVARLDADELGDRGATSASCDRLAARVSPARAAPGSFTQQRHLERLAVEQDRVLLLAVVAEPLAVVGGDDHERAVVERRVCAQVVEQLAHDGVGGGHLAVVRGAVARAERLRRVPRDVRLVDVEEVEERRRRVRVDPAPREAERDAARAAAGPRSRSRGAGRASPRSRRTAPRGPVSPRRT